MTLSNCCGTADLFLKNILAVALMIIILVLAGCARDEYTERDRIEAAEIDRVVLEHYKKPIVVYPEFDSRNIAVTVSEAHAQIARGADEEAVDLLSQAADELIELRGDNSIMLLPIYDKQIELYYRSGNIEDADKLQHHYREIIGSYYAHDSEINRDADYRLGCWHSLIHDWHNALFDFEDVLTHHRANADVKSGASDQMVNASTLAEIAAQQCMPR